MIKLHIQNLIPLKTINFRFKWIKANEKYVLFAHFSICAYFYDERRDWVTGYGHIFHIIITKLFCYLGWLESFDRFVNLLQHFGAPMKTGLNCIFHVCFDKIPDLLQWQCVLRIFRDVWRKCTLSYEYLEMYFLHAN